MMKRRTFIQAMLAGSSLNGLATVGTAVTKTKPKIVVIGAGAFGGWTALNLQLRGAQVSLLDTWGAGHTRASSGGETRVIRHAYGSPVYVRMVKRSLELWQAAEYDWGQPFYHKTGLLFMGPEQAEGDLNKMRNNLDQAAVSNRMFDSSTLQQRFPQIDFSGIKQAIYEPDAGFLMARQACEAVLEAFVEAGGYYQTTQALPGKISGGAMMDIGLSGGSRLKADQYVFACGPWLKQLFPELLGPLIQISRQEVYYFGLPPGAKAFSKDKLPIWADFGERLWYGIPATDLYGFKIADDTRGNPLEPTSAERTPSQDGIQRARTYLHQRFPKLKSAPLIDARVCQYSNTPDGDFIIDQHPEARNVWLAGGGSGHGYKHGPALGEMLAESVLQKRSIETMFGLSRFV